MFDEVKQVDEQLMLVNFRGMIMRMTPEEYREFVESIAEWSN